MILIPDIHGRSFWKEAVKDRIENEEIIFLGDYLDNYGGEIDAYTEEEITNTTALSNFKEIIEFARTNTGITLLLGNHDVEYFLPYCPDCRMDVFNKKEIRQLFIDNRDLFKIGYNIQAKNTIISHAGLTEIFIQFYYKTNVEDPIKSQDFFDCIDDLNALFEVSDDERLGTLLGKIGPYRGGWDSTGSPVWADFSELKRNSELCPRQIVGHSQYNPISMDKEYFRVMSYDACLDCRTAFRVDLDTWKFTPITKVENARYV